MIFIFSGPHMPIGNIWSGISFRHDDSIFVALAEPCNMTYSFVFIESHFYDFKKLLMIHSNQQFDPTCSTHHFKKEIHFKKENLVDAICLKL